MNYLLNYFTESTQILEKFKETRRILLKFSINLNIFYKNCKKAKEIFQNFLMMFMKILKILYRLCTGYEERTESNFHPFTGRRKHNFNTITENYKNAFKISYIYIYI